MGYLSVIFLGKEYTIPEDVLVYIDLLDFTNSVQKQLMSAFSRKLQNTDVGCIGDDDMADEIRSQVNRFIGKLCDQGIYNRTVNDYLSGNKGYQLISKVNDAALQKAKALLMQKLNTLEAGYTDAINKAEGSITGMGFSIWSGSFVNHAIYAAMQASTIDKQAKAAEAEYQRDMAALTARMDAQYNGEQSRYIKNVYIPQMEAALTAFAYELLDKYLSDLIANCIFDAKALEYVDIKRSNDLLDNLKLSGNKKAILENAFLACPYNAAVYMQALKCEVLDTESFRTARTFKQDKQLLAFFKEACGKVSYPTEFKINYYAVNLLAELSGKNPQSLLHGMAEPYAMGIVKAYGRISEMLDNKDSCYRIVREMGAQSILSRENISEYKACSYVNSIVSGSVWEQLTEKCGYKILLDSIKKYVPNGTEVSCKEDVDKYFIKELAAKFEVARRTIVKEIQNKELAEKAEQERLATISANKKARFKKIVKGIVFGTASVIFAAVALFVGATIFWGVTDKPIDNDFEDRETYKLHELTYYVPGNWILDEDQSYENMKYYAQYNNFDEFMGVMGIKYAGEVEDITVDKLAISYGESYSDSSSIQNKTIDGQKFMVVTYNDIDNGEAYFYNIYITEQDSSVFLVYFMWTEENNKIEVFEKIVDAIEFENYKNPSKNN